MITYGQNITYTDFYGYKTTSCVSGCGTPEEALQQAIELIKDDGWAQPKWWQWWRWHDTRVDA